MDREKAIDLLDNLIGMVEDNQASDYDEALRMAIAELEQEPCDEWQDGYLQGVENTVKEFKYELDRIRCDNTISREAALKVASDECLEFRGIYGRIESRIRQLPPVQQSLTKESVIDYLQEIGWMQDHDRQMMEMGEPSRKGYWKRFEDDKCYWYGCSQCKHEISKDKWGYDDFSSFCPNCGADMREGDTE